MVTEEETVFLQGLCDSILNTAKAVRFAGIIDNTGRLLVGKYRPDVRLPLIKTNVSATDPKATSFYSAYEILLLHTKFQKDLGQLRFQLTEFDEVTLLSIPLNADNSRCLCISVDGQADSAIVDRIMNVID